MHVHNLLLVLWSSCPATKVLLGIYLATRIKGGGIRRVGQWVGQASTNVVCCNTLNWGALDNVSCELKLRVLQHTLAFLTLWELYHVSLSTELMTLMRACQSACM